MSENSQQLHETYEDRRAYQLGTCLRHRNISNLCSLCSDASKRSVKHVI